MGYYCTVPQCTSLAGKTKNVKFHRFPRDHVMADKWNVILKRGKPYTKYSKVCSLHFTQADYNVTAMGQWKTLSKDAVPSQNLPKLHPDGTVMVIRKSRTVKYKDHKKEDVVSKSEKWSVVVPNNSVPWSTPDRTVPSTEPQDSPLSYRLQKLNDLANIISPQEAQQTVSPPQTSQLPKPKKQDAIMQTDPLQPEEEELLHNSYSESSEKSYSPDQIDYQSTYSKEEYSKEQYSKEDQYSKNQDQYPKEQEQYPKDQGSYSKDQGTYTKDQIDYSKDEASYSKDQSSYTKDQSSYTKDQSDYSKELDYSKDQASYSKDQSYSKDEGFSKEQEGFSKEQYKEDYAQKKYEAPKDYTKPAEDYIPQTNEEYNKEAEKYALERKSHNGYEKGIEYQKQMTIENGYQKIADMYAFSEKQADFEPRTDGFAPYQSTYADSVELLRSQQHNLHMLQEQHRINENQNFFNENHIKQEIDFGNEEEKFMYDRNKEPISKYDSDLQSEYERQLMEQRILQQMHHQVKQEPDTNNGCESVMQPQTSPYYSNGHSNVTGGYYEQMARPGPELLIAKQNALAAHTQLWQNTMKRPFFYSDSTHYTPQLLHRYEDVTRIQQ